MSAATATKLAYGEYTREEAQADERLMREQHDERLRALASLPMGVRHAMRARVLRVLPLDLAVDAREELARAERMAAKIGSERRPVLAATRGSRTRSHVRTPGAANTNTDDDGPAARRDLANGTTTHKAVETLLDELVNALADMVAERCVARGGAGATSDEYTSKNLPPDMSRRAFNERCRRLGTCQRV